jgi:putative spermidine/putrescine transport system ATP-binding protein
VRGVSFAGGTREYVLETAFGPIKEEADAGLPAHDLGATVAFDLPVERAARLERD